MGLRREVEELEGNLALLGGQIERYTDDVKALQETEDAMLAEEVETAARTALPESIASAASSLEAAYDEFAVALGTWGKERRQQRSIKIEDTAADADSYPARAWQYASVAVENIQTVLDELFNRNVQMEESPPDVDATYDERTARRLDQLTDSFHDMMEDIRTYDSHIEDRFGVTVADQVEEQYGSVTGLTYTPSREQPDEAEF